MYALLCVRVDKPTYVVVMYTKEALLLHSERLQRLELCIRVMKWIFVGANVHAFMK